MRYYKIGVGFIDLTGGKHKQAGLFDESPSNPALMKAFDDLNQKYDSGAVFLAA